MSVRGATPLFVDTGAFYARIDEDDEPPDTAWLSILCVCMQVWFDRTITVPTEADSTRRALLTDAEREHIRGEKENQQRSWETISRVRNRIGDRMAEDVAILAEPRPELLDGLRGVVREE